jgi:hypothetical protein
MARILPGTNSKAKVYYPTALTSSTRKPLTLPSLDAYAKGEEFETLAKLGPKIVPLVVRKLATSDDQPPYGVLVCKSVAVHVYTVPLLIPRKTTLSRRTPHTARVQMSPVTPRRSRATANKLSSSTISATRSFKNDSSSGQHTVRSTHTLLALIYTACATNTMI